MSEIRINARQRKVIKIVLILAGALLLLGLIIDAVGQAATPSYTMPSRETIYRRDPLTQKYREMARPAEHIPARFDFGEFVPGLLRAPRLYIAGLLIGLAVFIHRGPKD